MLECVSQDSILSIFLPQLFSQQMEWPKDSMGIIKWYFFSLECQVRESEDFQ